MKTQLAFTEVQINELVDAYARFAHYQKNINGHPGYVIFSTPGGDCISLHKMTRRVKNAPNTDEKMKKKLRLEIEKRCLEASQPCISGFEFYFTDKFKNQQKECLDSIQSLILDTPILEKLLEQNCEYPEINEIMQRVKDAKHMDAEVDEMKRRISKNSTQDKAIRNENWEKLVKKLKLKSKKKSKKRKKK